MKGKGQSVEEAIRIEAYLLSERAGHPPGMDGYFWEQAQTIVKARATVVSTAVKKVADAKAKAKTAEKIKPAAKLKTAKKTAAASAPAKEPQLPLKDEARAPARKGSSKK